MPIYTYIDENGHAETITEPMMCKAIHICAACGLVMWRKPLAATVTWGGIKPSGGYRPPEVQRLLDTVDQRRDAFAKKHEEHERRKSND